MNLSFPPPVPPPLLAQRLRGLIQRGIYPLLLWDRDGVRVVELDSRDVLHWVEAADALPPRCLVGFPCHAPQSQGDFSALEKQRLALVTATYLARGYVTPPLLTRRNGDAWYIDGPNAEGLQFSMGMTDAAGGRLRASLRLLLPALTPYDIRDVDQHGWLRVADVRHLELPVHTLLGGVAEGRAARLAARHRVHVIGELSQLVSTTHSAKAIQDVCAVFGAFARAVTAPRYRPQVFDRDKGVAIAVSAVPKLAAMLERVVWNRLAPQLAAAAQVTAEQVGPPVWRRGTEEVPLLLCVRAPRVEAAQGTVVIPSSSRDLCRTSGAHDND
jgi:hypothetical protein